MITWIHIMADIIKVTFNSQLTKIFISLKTVRMRIKNIENKYLTWFKFKQGSNLWQPVSLHSLIIQADTLIIDLFMSACKQSGKKSM